MSIIAPIPPDPLSILVHLAEKGLKRVLGGGGGGMTFVGMPGAGKSVLFACAIDALQRYAEAHPKRFSEFSIRSADVASDKFVRRSIEKMKNSKWPPKTEDGHVFRFLLRYSYLRRQWYREMNFDNHDFPGEAYLSAFCAPDTVPPDDPHREEAVALKASIRASTGIFLVIDGVSLHDGLSDDIADCLFGFCQFVAGCPAIQRIAVVYTKKDMFRHEPDFRPEKVFQSKYSDAWVQLKTLKHQKVRHFFVSCVGSTITNSKGVDVPAPGYDTAKADGLLPPIQWILGQRRIR